MTQDRIIESGTDRLSDMDFDGCFKAARRLDLNHLANDAFHLASRRPPTHSAPMPTTYTALPCMSFLFLHSHPLTAAIPAAMHTPSCTLPPGIPMDVDCTRTLKPIAQTCYCCGQTSHISRDCDIHYDIRHMMLDEQDEFRSWPTVTLQSQQLGWAQVKAHWWREKSITRILSDPAGE
jgi:hypothetical protein